MKNITLDPILSSYSKYATLLQGIAVKWSLLSGPVGVLATSTKALIRLDPNLCRSQEISCHLIPKSAFVICNILTTTRLSFVHNGTEYAQIAKVQATANCKFASNLLTKFLNNIISGFSDYLDLNKLLTQKLLKQGYRYHKLRKTFSKFYRRYFDLISKFQVGLKSLLRQGLSEPDFYGDLVYKLKKIVGSNNFSAQFIKIISHYKKIGYNINVLQQTACLVVNPITVGNFAFLFNCTPVGRTSDSMMVPT